MKIQSTYPNIYIYVTHHENLNLKIPKTLIPLDVTKTDGENIGYYSDYCELRGHYYVWKNLYHEPHDYVGFFHPRRYLDFRSDGIKPYTIVKSPVEEDYSAHFLSQAIIPYDLVVPIPEKIGISVKERYSIYKTQSIEDLCVLEDLILSLYPEFSKSTDFYLNNTEEFYCNMYVMKRELFDEYSAWVFSILNEYDKKNPDKKTNSNGYLGERLLGIYITHLMNQNRFKIKFCPRKHFYQYDDKYHNFKRKKFELTLIPLNSNRRDFLQKLKYYTLKRGD